MFAVHATVLIVHDTAESHQPEGTFQADLCMALSYTRLAKLRLIASPV